MSELRMQYHRECGGPLQVAVDPHSGQTVIFCGWCIEAWSVNSAISNAHTQWRDGEFRAARPVPTGTAKILKFKTGGR